MSYPVGITFIIPAYNEEGNVVSCVNSIQKEVLRHPELKYEMIVVDNNSTDNTAREAASTGAQVLFEAEKGVVFARNAGYRKAKYSYIANIDCDNKIPEGWIDIALREIEKSEVSAISGPLVYEDVSPLITLGGEFFYLIARSLHHLVGPTLQGGNYIIKKEVLDKMNGYDTSFDFYGEDSRTAQCASEFGTVKLIPDLWILASPRRIKGQGLVNTIWKYSTNYFWVCFFGKPMTNKYRDYR